MDYYAKQKAKVNIMDELVNRGWKIYGYKPDESDSMVDYFSPARWEGIAEKDGYILLIDVRGTYDSGRKVTRQGFTADYEKIRKLEALRDDAAASEGEKRNCQTKINELLQKEKESVQIVSEYPTFTQANPKRNTWHIEKDGQIIAKGNGLNACHDSNNREEAQKAVASFVDRLEKAITNNTELKTEIVRTPVTVTKPVQKDDTTINKGDILSFSYHGHFWIVTDVYTVGEQVRVLYELLGSAKRGYQRLSGTSVKRFYQPLVRLEKEMAEGKVKVYTMQQVTEYVEKTVYKKTSRKPKYNAAQIEMVGDVEQELTQEETTQTGAQEEKTKSNNVVQFPRKQEEEKENNSMVNNEPEVNVSGDFLSMLDQVEIKNNSRIAADDMAYCTRQQEQYKQAITALETALESFKAMTSENGYIEKYHDITPLEKRIKNVKERFIDNICWHFENKYNVSIEHNFSNKYGTDITYEQILDEIFIQLGGYSFEEKAVKEIKDNMKQLVARWGDSTKHMEIKGNKITFDSLYIVTHCSIFKRYEIGYNSRQNAIKFFEALTNFDNGQTGMHWEFDDLYLKNNRDEYLFEKHELSLSKVKTIKMFKNRRIDIEFSSNELAKQFAREYCGYTKAA